MIVWQYVLMYNEMRILPFMVNYWKTYADKVIVINNMSNDGSVEYLRSINDLDIEIHDYDSNNQANDFIYLKIKNNIWKEARGKADFVVVSDCDETLITKNGTTVRDELRYMLNNGQTICRPIGVNTHSYCFPEYSDKLLHTYEKSVRPWGSESSKEIVFNPNRIDEINYTLGAHTDNPIGDVNYYDNNKLILYHCADLSLGYILDKYHRNKKRVPIEYYEKFKLAVHYFYDDEKIINDYNEGLKNCINIDDIINNE